MVIYTGLNTDRFEQLLDFPLALAQRTCALYTRLFGTPPFHICVWLTARRGVVLDRLEEGWEASQTSLHRLRPELCVLQGTRATK